MTTVVEGSYDDDFESRPVTKELEKKPENAITEGVATILDAEESKPKKPQSEGIFAWRHYHTLYPVCNKLLAKRWDQLSRANHKARMERVAKSIDDAPPVKYLHLMRNAKKKQMQTERQADIVRTNQILVDKMAYITKTETMNATIKHFTKRMELAHERHEVARRRVNKRIQDENQAILHRLESCKSDYDHVKTHEEILRMLYYSQNLSSYPNRYVSMIKTEEERSERYQSQLASHSAAANSHSSQRALNIAYGQVSGTSDAIDTFGFGGTRVRIQPDGSFSVGKKKAAVGKGKGKNKAADAMLPVAAVDNNVVQGAVRPGSHKVPPITPSGEAGDGLKREESPLDKIDKKEKKAPSKKRGAVKENKDAKSERKEVITE